jgi:prophage regulatory protein
MPLLKISEVCALTRMSRATIYRRLSEGHFPVPLALGIKIRRWKKSEVEAWLEAQR